MSEDEFTIVNARTGEPIHNHLGHKRKYESEDSAEKYADQLSSGNEDDFEAKRISELPNAAQ